MKPADLRNATWAEVQTHLGEDLLRVHAAYLEHGPGTTRQLSEKSGISLLTLRPRTTDLYQLGLVECTGRTGSEGIYSHVPHATAAARWAAGLRPADEKSAPPVNTLSLKDRLLAQIRDLPVADQLSIAGSIRASAQHAPRDIPNPAQQELFA